MADYSAEEVKERYDKLPPEVKTLLYSPEMSFTIQQIGQKNALHIDQIDSLNTEAGQVMLGFIEVKDFVSELMEMLSIDQAKAAAIAQDVNDMLFSKIREAMQKVYEMNKTPPTIASAPVPTPTIAPTPAPVSKLPPLPTAPKAPLSTPPAMNPSPTPPIPPKPPLAPTPNMAQANVMLSQKTVEMPQPAANPAAPKKPQPPVPENYKKDPYREPIEP